MVFSFAYLEEGSVMNLLETVLEIDQETPARKRPQCDPGSIDFGSSANVGDLLIEL
jgi:hypothetical protein